MWEEERRLRPSLALLCRVDFPRQEAKSLAYPQNPQNVHTLPYPFPCPFLTSIRRPAKTDFTVDVHDCSSRFACQVSEYIMHVDRILQTALFATCRRLQKRLFRRSFRSSSVDTLAVGGKGSSAQCQREMISSYTLPKFNTSNARPFTQPQITPRRC